MTNSIVTFEKYLHLLPEDRKVGVRQLREVILNNLPEGFTETISSSMVEYVVPHSVYPAGYHCNPKQPLPFLSIVSQKNLIALYHLGLYADNELLTWFTEEYPKYCKTKLNMGKGCVRFKNPDQIPFRLIGELSSKMTAVKWIDVYEQKIKR